MSITAAITVVSLPVACVAVAAALMRLFDVKDITIEQAELEAEKLLSQANQELKVRRRVRAGAPRDAVLADFSRLSSPSAVRLRFPSV